MLFLKLVLAILDAYQVFFGALDKQTTAIQVSVNALDEKVNSLDGKADALDDKL